jgi:CubicO group peptidase (beta-lactamase class C family)
VDWADHIIQVLIDMTLEEYMQEHIFKPIGMVSSTFAISKRPDHAKRRTIIRMQAVPRKPLTAGSDPLAAHLPCNSGGTGFCSIASGYAKVLAELVQWSGGAGQAGDVRGYVSASAAGQ